ncbi:polyphosphate--glucose phosphotransferase [Nocardioides yefusunii]|uniref:Polyphosphate--glucose phosphotransferase n=1 Tax=Nocardioides yefusunii TaxID=2500546 RepID=A0ABW1R2I8_9ACTN|nr:ROK family protein [Nocardioides yefusunii]
MSPQFTSKATGARDDVRIGIDFGGTGIKGAAVDLATGELAGPKRRLDTPRVSTPDAVLAVFREVLEFNPRVDGPVGITVPGIVADGVIGRAPNIHPDWVGLDAAAFLTEGLQREVSLINDADAAALAEHRYGAAAGRNGTVLVTTLGTGIGAGLLRDGVLVPNVEVGHIPMHGTEAEKWASTSARELVNLSWTQWAERLTEVYGLFERIFTPDLIVVGGGVSKAHEKFLPHVEVTTEIVPATLRNRAGIVGCALLTTF